jgi:hypothetical protein
MYLVVIAWMYVVLMMAVAEATSPNGTLLGAIVTLLLYGVGPVALVVYLMGSPMRRKALRRKDAEELAARRAADAQTAGAQKDDAPAEAGGSGLAPNAGGKAAADAVAPVRKED